MEQVAGVGADAGEPPSRMVEIVSEQPEGRCGASLYGSDWPIGNGDV
jgi:hypothetical protein